MPALETFEPSVGIDQGLEDDEVDFFDYVWLVPYLLIFIVDEVLYVLIDFLVV